MKDGIYTRGQHNAGHGFGKDDQPKEKEVYQQKHFHIEYKLPC